MSQIVSEKIESSEDILSGDFCICGHLIEGEHILGKCFGLDFNETVWIGCRCSNPKSHPVVMKGIFLSEIEKK